MRRAHVLALAVSLLAGLMTAVPAAAASCPSAGGQPWGFAQADSDGDFVFSGKGYGHGVGMSQYGARGAAKLGCTAADILTTYYEGVSVGAQTMPSGIRVGLVPNVPTRAPSKPDYFRSPLNELTFVNTSANPIPWLFDGRDLRDLGGPAQPAWATWRVELKTDAAKNMAFFVIVESGKGEVWRSQSQSTSPGNALVAALDSKRTLEVAAKDREYFRGRLELFSSLSGITLTANLSFEQYLYGLSEMSSSWESEALKAQAIVGRSYAAVATKGGWEDNCRCDLYDTVYDQHYTGYDKESEGTDQVWGKRWVAAVDGTRGTVIHKSGTIVTGNYASSHGGHSEDAAFVWPSGGGASHLKPVDDSAWEAASGNPYRTWTLRRTPAELGKAFGVGTAISVELPAPRGVSGRIGDPAYGAGGMRVIGTDGTVTVSGDTARAKLGLRSTLFTVVGPPVGGIPITGDWDGNGTSELGWFRDGDFILRRADGSVIRFRFGRAGDLPVVGDWDGNGSDTVGVVRDTAWFLRNSHSGGGADLEFVYGRTGDIPLPGNWNPDRRGDEAGIIRDGTWHLNDRLGGGTARYSFHYGRVSLGDIPITGDWRGEGRDRVGIVRDGEWHLRYEYAGGSSDNMFVYGRVTRGDRPVTGDWDANLSDTPGVVRGAYWHLRNSNTGGNAHQTLFFPG